MDRTMRGKIVLCRGWTIRQAGHRSHRAGKGRSSARWPRFSNDLFSLESVRKGTCAVSSSVGNVVQRNDFCAVRAAVTRWGLDESQARLDMRLLQCSVSGECEEAQEEQRRSEDRRPQFLRRVQ